MKNHLLFLVLFFSLTGPVVADMIPYKNKTQRHDKRTHLLVHYFRSLRYCHKGTYHYEIGSNIIKSTIHGIKGNNCLVTSFFQSVSGLAKNKKTYSEVCQYERVNLFLFTDQAAESLADSSKSIAEINKYMKEIESKYCIKK